MRGAFSWAAGCRCTEVTTEPLAGSPEAVLRFWFDESRPAQWFRRNQAFDQTIQRRFGALVEAALDGGLGHWSDFSRATWRGQPKAFEGDAQALALSLRAEKRGWIAAETHQPRR